jgi:hypothetical protein
MTLPAKSDCSDDGQLYTFSDIPTAAENGIARICQYVQNLTKLALDMGLLIFLFFL